MRDASHAVDAHGHETVEVRAPTPPPPAPPTLPAPLARPASLAWLVKYEGSLFVVRGNRRLFLDRVAAAFHGFMRQDLHDGAKQTGKDSGPRRVCQPIPQEVQATPSANASSSAGPIGPPLVPTARQQHEQKDIKGSSGSSSSSSTDSSNICKTFFFVQPCPGLRGKSR